MGLSAGSFVAFIPQSNELPETVILNGPGISLRYATYSALDFEANFSAGDYPKSGFSTWKGATFNFHGNTIIPRTYLLFGFGVVWRKPTEQFLAKHNSRNYYDDYFYRPALIQPRIGFGVTDFKVKKFNVRLEADLIGIRAYVERRIN